jgi:glutaredoxin
MQEQVKVYTRPLCLFCHQVLDLLRQANVAFGTIEVTDRRQQEELCAHHGAAAFPVVLVNGVYLGGYAHILHLHSQGRLRSLGVSVGPSLHSPESPGPLPASDAPSPSTRSTQPSTRSTEPSIAGRMSAMARLQQALTESQPKKR